ncbi:hypothetical protein [Rubrivirga sp.]|uniref:hypothetical protein n=1 Tax=Rubrivirga sp. TaxID=1885344 RepID=UPI003B5292DB
MFKQGVEEGEIEPAADPFLTYKKPKAKPVHRRRLSLDEVEKLRDAALDPASRKTLGHRDLATTEAYVKSFDQDAEDDLWT